MFNKGKIFLLTTVLVLAFAQAALPALTAVGPINPQNGFPLWYRDSTGQTVTLSVPPAAVSIPDAPDPAFPFGAQIGFGSEAMYWHSTAIIDPIPGGGQALLVLALEAAFAAENAVPGDQVVFARVRIRIDAPNAGTYTVTHPYGTKTFTVAAADVGDRAINDTSDIGIGSPGVFTGPLSGAIDPFLVQTGFPALSGGVTALGDAGTEATVTGSPAGNNFFRVVGPAAFGTVETNLFVTGAEVFAGTPFTVTRATFSRDAAGAAVAEVFATAPDPVTPGTTIRAVIPGQAGVALTRRAGQFFGRIPFTVPFTANIGVRGFTNGINPTRLPVTLVDTISVTTATFAVGTGTLSLAAVSSDAQATLAGSGWFGAGAGQPLAAAGAVTNFVGVPIAPVSVTVTSSSGGTVTVSPVILP